MNRTLKDQVEELRRVYTLVDSSLASYLHVRPGDLNKIGKIAVVYIIFDAHDGNATLYKLVLDKTDSEKFGDDYDVESWAKWIKQHVPRIVAETTIPYLNRNLPGRWRPRGVIGWHFLKLNKSERNVYLQKRHQRGEEDK